MSELTLFSKGGNNLPAHLRNLQLDETTKALMGGSSSTGKRISIRGGVFRMIVDGKEVAQNEDRSMNIAGSAKQGSGRACRYSQRLAVTLENDLQGDVYQLTLPAQSIFGNVEGGKMPMQAYAKFLGGHGLPITAVVTEMRFDTASATPKLTFKAVRPLEEDELLTCQTKGQTPEAKAAIDATPAMLDGAKPKAAEPEAPAAEPVKREKKAAPKDVGDILDDWADQ